MTPLSWLRAYDRSLKGVLRHRLATFVISLVLLAATLYMFIRIPKGFLPSEDSGLIVGFTQAARGISIEAMRAHQQAVTSIVQEDPNIQEVFSLAGAGFAGFAGNSGLFFCNLKPHPLRRLSTDEVMNVLRPKLFSVPGILAFMQNPLPIQIGGRLTKSLYQFTLQGTDTEKLYRASDILLARMSQLPGLQDVTTDLQIANPQVNIEVDWDKAAALGVSAFQVEDALSSAYGDRQISTIYAPNNEYRVITELEPQFQLDPAAMSMLYIRSSSGRLVPLTTLAKFTESLGPLAVNHSGQLPSVTLSFGLRAGTALGDAVDEVQQLERDTLPATISASFQGEAGAYQASLAGLGVLLTLTIVVIYVLLGILYESFIHPLTILSGLPSAGFGALVTLMLFHYELNIYGFVGLIMLIGIVKKNAIMMIDFALETERKEGKSSEDAIYEGCLIRFRPIMMTTMAALMGTLPIALGFGAGADARRPLGLAVVGGLLVSQLLTLYITPVYYTYLASLQRKTRTLLRRRPATPVIEVAVE